MAGIKDVVDAIEADFLAWNASLDPNDYSVQYENQAGFSKPDNEVYIKLTTLFGSSDTAGLGATATYRQTGIVVAMVIGPFGVLRDNVDAACQLIQNEYAYKRISSQGIYFYAPYPTPVGRAGGEFQINMNLPFTVDYTKVKE